VFSLLDFLQDKFPRIFLAKKVFQEKILQLLVGWILRQDIETEIVASKHNWNLWGDEREQSVTQV
jgi:hypothetical protein